MTHSPVLIAAKLMRPPARANLVARPRLFARLDSAAPITLVTAPAGFGKTTLVSAWLSKLAAVRPTLASAWLALDADDNDLTRCLTYLVAALEQVQPGIGAGTLSLLRSSQPPAEAVVLATLANDLQALSETPGHPAVLVLDDFHTLEAPGAQSAFSFLLERLPLQLRVVMTSRAEPAGQPLARWRAQGRLAELALADLRFTEDEAQAFFHEVMALPLPAEEVETLTARTEGWVAGLQMAALARGGLGAPARASDDLSGTHRYVADYLLDEVFSRQPLELRAFLCAVAFLDRLSGPLCAAVTGQTQSDALLEGLARANLFITRLDEGGQWYRLHQLFREFLLQQPAPEAQPSLAERQRRASAWFSHEPGGQGEAVALALAAGDTAAAARLMAAVAPQLMQHGEFSTLRQWLERLPEDAIWANPRLGLTRVWLLLDVYQPQQALAYLERYSAAVEREAAGSIQAEALSLQAVCLAMQRRPEQALALAQQAEQAGLGSDPFVQAHVLFSLAAAYKMGHQNALAEHAFRQAAAVAAANDNPYLAFSCFGNLGDIYFNSARLREAEAANRRALEFAALASGGEQPYAGWLHWSQARIYYEWNDLPGAQREAALCLAQCRRWGNQAMAVRALLVLAQAAQARHEPGAARAHLDEADELARQVEDERLLAGVIRQRVALAVATRDLDLARRWEATLPAGTDQASVNHCLARARLSLAEGRPRAALEHLARALAALAPTDLVTLRVQVLALEAVARRAHGQPEAALAALEQALALAGPGGFVRTFLDEAAPMRELLRRVAARAPGPADSQRLLAAFAQATAPPAEALALTVRERQILRLMAAGLSNRDMAEELVIAEATLKRHVSNLYGKLEAHSRTQALARAASLKLL